MKRVKQMKREFTAIFEKRGKWYVAYVEEIPGVNTQGKTLKEARENLKDALRLIIEANRELASRNRKRVRREAIAVEA